MPLTLFQAEWCPHSHRVRQRLTELGVDFLARQVAADPDDRHEMRDSLGVSEIPTLVPDDGEPISGTKTILAYLNERYDEREDAPHHREKAREEVPLFAEVRRAT